MSKVIVNVTNVGGRGGRSVFGGDGQNGQAGRAMNVSEEYLVAKRSVLLGAVRCNGSIAPPAASDFKTRLIGYYEYKTGDVVRRIDDTGDSPDPLFIVRIDDDIESPMMCKDRHGYDVSKHKAEVVPYYTEPQPAGIIRAARELALGLIEFEEWVLGQYPAEAGFVSTYHDETKKTLRAAVEAAQALHRALAGPPESEAPESP